MIKERREYESARWARDIPASEVSTTEEPYRTGVLTDARFPNLCENVSETLNTFSNGV